MTYSKLVVAVFAIFAAFTTARATKMLTKERKQFVDAKIDALLKKARKDGKSMNSCPKWYKVTIPGYGTQSGTLHTDKNCRRISYSNPSTPPPKVRTSFQNQPSLFCFCSRFCDTLTVTSIVNGTRCSRLKVLCRGRPKCSIVSRASGTTKYADERVKNVVGPKDCNLKEWTYAAPCPFVAFKGGRMDYNHAWMKCDGIMPWKVYFKYSKCEIYTPAMEAAMKAAAEKKKKKETTQKETTQKERKKKKEKEDAAKKAAAAAEQAAKKEGADKEGAKKKETADKKVATAKEKQEKAVVQKLKETADKKLREGAVKKETAEKKETADKKVATAKEKQEKAAVQKLKETADKKAAAAEQAAKKEGAKKKETSGKKVATPKFRKKKAAAKRRLCGKENDSCACPSGSIMRYGHALLGWMKKKCDVSLAKRMSKP